jgi:hypothetical protein
MPNSLNCKGETGEAALEGIGEINTMSGEILSRILCP